MSHQRGVRGHFSPGADISEAKQLMAVLRGSMTAIIVTRSDEKIHLLALSFKRN